MNRIDRLTGIILQLQSHRSITAAEIAAHWEVSLRTIYRDIAALGEAGVPIVGEAGAGYRLMRGYHLPPVMFTSDEAAAMFMSGEIAEQIADESLKRALRSALLKIRSVLPEERQAYLARLKQSMSVSLRSRSPEEPARNLMPIEDAILRRRCLALKYQAAGRTGVTSRTVEPLGITYYGDQWHVIAFCRLRQDFRDFRLDRMKNWEVLGETFKGHDDFSIREFLGDVIKRHELIPVTVSMDRKIADPFRAQIFSTLESESVLDDGRVQMEILTFSLQWFAWWVLRFGTALQVEEPAELRQLVKQAAAGIVGQYGKPPKKSQPC
jgi:predicted DNA-binding transcriptional regulator YafY